ncbi:2-oxo acid dehydrogenase subunit E2 [Micromonospora sp. NPDC005652]|uniref:2-oxo acid dehydrogenase subunit E2 n=1 Tax=Micromonospora sp. NPDC005652 TaxID=3157046 RepID=UPI0033F6CE62
MGDLTISRLNSNDETYILLEWLVPAASEVAAGDAVATIETSKAVTDLVCAESGFLTPRVEAGATCRPGDIVGYLSSKRPVPAQGVERATPAPEAASIVVTRSAQELIDRHGISATQVAGLGKRVVKALDVQSLLGAVASDGRRTPLAAHQRAVARTVQASHLTIPAAFLVAKVSATELVAAQRHIGQRARAFIGLPELVISAVARLWKDFPHCFATVHDDLTVEPAERPDIGVTIDVGTGLYVPVIPGADALGVTELASRLMDFRVRAMRRGFRDADLGPARLTLSLQMESGIMLSRPIIFPGQVCVLSMCGLQNELGLDADGAVRPHEYFHLGLTYDHRAINGREAAAFLTAIKGALERPINDVHPATESADRSE